MSYKAYLTISELSKHPDISSALADMIIIWSAVENALVALTHKLLGTTAQKSTIAFYSHTSLHGRINMIKRLVREFVSDKTVKDNLLTSLTKITNLATTRNSYVHGKWASDYKGTVVVFDLRKLPNSTKRKKTVKAVDIRNHIRAVHRRLDCLWETIEQLKKVSS